MMADPASLPDSKEEVQAPRARVTDLEHRPGDLGHVEDPPVSEPMHGDSTGETRAGAAEKAVDGFFKQSLVMMIIADLVEGRFLRINNKVCEVLGLTEKEILESSFLDRVHPDDIPKTIREMGRLSAGERTTNFQNRHLGADGNYRVFSWSAVADENRELCYAMAIELTE
jgi:PAS domain S-box-containing protein